MEYCIYTVLLGVYGNNYLLRAAVAYKGLGAVCPEDGVYAFTSKSSDGAVLSNKSRYVIHFDVTTLPPVTAFWSITIYDASGYPISNEMNRHAIGDRDDLQYNSDGSLDIYVQAMEPLSVISDGSFRCNWLPSGTINDSEQQVNLTMRLYAPLHQVFELKWNPPVVQEILDYNR